MANEREKTVPAAQHEELLEAHADLAKELDAVCSAKDGAYRERNRVVAAFARLARGLGWRLGIARTEIPDWEPEWQNCLFVETPLGQVSWHFHDSEREVFDDFPPYDGAWDGHTNDEKYARLDRLWRTP